MSAGTRAELGMRGRDIVNGDRKRGATGREKDKKKKKENIKKKIRSSNSLTTREEILGEKKGIRVWGEECRARFWLERVL